MIVITAVEGDLYLATATEHDEEESWSTPTPVSAQVLIKELLSRGFHQTDIGDAFYAADPNWLSKTKREP